jgi:hypothetical protein
VHLGDSISLDWNPVFDPIWPVSGLRGFVLTFSAVAVDGVSLKRPKLQLGTRLTPTSISPLGNGFFHIESTVNTRAVPAGIYRMVRAKAFAEVVPEYAEQSPQMTNSPVGERYCITIVRPPASQSPQPRD